MKNFGFCLLAAIAVFVSSLQYVAATNTGGNNTKTVKQQICDCSTIAKKITKDYTKQNNTKTNNNRAYV